MDPIALGRASTRVMARRSPIAGSILCAEVYQGLRAKKVHGMAAVLATRLKAIGLQVIDHRTEPILEPYYGPHASNLRVSGVSS